MRFFTARTWYSITLGHQMSWGYIWPNVSMTRSLTKCQPDPKPDLWVEGCMWYLLFLYTFETLEADISLHVVIFTYFCLEMLGIEFGWSGMAWQMIPTPSEGISLKYSKTYFWSTFHSLSPLFFFNIVNVSGTEIHLKFTYPYHFYLNVKLLDGCISLHIDIFVTYFLSGNFWGGCFTCYIHIM